MKDGIKSQDKVAELEKMLTALDDADKKANTAITGFNEKID